MTVLFCRNRVADFSTWKAVFDSHAPAHREAGLSLTNLWRDIEDPNNVFFVFDVANLDRAQAFINAPAGADAGRIAGVIEGEFHFLTPGLVAESAVASVPTEACAWCGAPVTEDEAFMLRVGARLCATCAEQAGRIAAEQGRTNT
ncbi:MAG: hypothetical protein NT151_04700 [Acidobacteria bacterium]|nr:hypothetical protein [Acidobacteriota bacterium]